jgi:hypothetical protein
VFDYLPARTIVDFSDRDCSDHGSDLEVHVTNMFATSALERVVVQLTGLPTKPADLQGHTGGRPTDSTLRKIIFHAERLRVIVTAAGADHPGSVIWSLVSLDRVAVPSADWIVHGFRKLEARPTASAFLAVARLRKPVRPVTGMMPYRESAAADGA